MVNSRSSRKKKTEFFGAVSKNCKTVIVREHKKEVTQAIKSLLVTGNNIAIFKCRAEGENTIAKKPIHRPKFKLTSDHHAVLAEASCEFLAQWK